MQEIFRIFKQNRALDRIFIANVFLALHYFLIYYVNSTYLSGFFSETQISALYIIGSIINTVLLLNASKVLNTFGVYRATLFSVGGEFVATMGMILGGTPIIVGLSFLLHLVVISFIIFNFDILIEYFSKDASTVGEVRAIYLTTSNVTVVLTQVLLALLFVEDSYFILYIVSSLLIIPIFIYLKKFQNLSTPPIKIINIRQTIQEYLRDKDLYDIFGAQFLLQLFYAFMGVYTPLYLQKYMGFSWSEIGMIFTIMLLPFIFIEFPIANLEDKKYGEQEFLVLGFVIMGISTIFLSFITAASVVAWATILFITRIGASLVEVSCEGYFFKHVHQDKPNIISLFRITRPLSFIISPLLAALALQFIPFQYTFIMIGGLMILGVHYSLNLRDTR
jgi:MFS family permease